MTEGINSAGVTEWFGSHVQQVTNPLRFELIAGGRSNLTYRVTDADGSIWALRRPPLHHVLPTAHDMRREHRVISALWSTPVPVPQTFGLCTDEEVNGAPFYVMEFVEGHILRDVATAESALAEDVRPHAGESMTKTLAALHSVDVDEVGLSDFAKRDGYLERQLKRWSEQFRASRVPGVDTADAVEAVHERLAASVPPQRSTAIVHGDFRLDNCVLSSSGEVRAVLDWEICTLGDPLADVGLLMVYWAEPGDPAALTGLNATTAPGFPSRAEMRRMYEEYSGRDLSDLDYYTAFGYFKLACIAQGVYARYVGGAAAGDRSSVEGFGSSVVTLSEMAMETLDGRGRS